MKKYLYLVICGATSLHFAFGAWTEEDRRIESEQVALWESKLSAAESNPSNAEISELWLGLRNMGHRRSQDGHDSSVDVIYGKLQAELLSIPGHAQMIGDQIRAAYEPLKGPNPSIAITPAQNEMMYGFATLKHLPSPENVKVLGGMLSETWRMAPNEGFRPLALSDVAVTTLGDLGIRNAPSQPIITGDKIPGAIPVWQAWWEEVKSGRKTFSFKGQSVEYRFRPDGTWETLAMVNAPDDGPQMAGKVKRPGDRKTEQVAGEIPRAWVWLALPVILVVGFAVWLVARRKKTA